MIAVFIMIMIAVMVFVVPIVIVFVTIAIVILDIGTRLNHVKGYRKMGEDLGSRLVIQHGGVDHAGVEENCIFHASFFANRASARGLRRREVLRIERLCGNAEFDRRLLAEQRLARRHAPAGA